MQNIDGSVGHSPFFVMRVYEVSVETSRFGVVISQKVAKKAVDRHRLKRRIHGCLESLTPVLNEGYAVVIYAKKQAHTAETQELCNELKRLLTNMTILQ